MALVSVLSAKGSPGVSTFATALAALWPGDSLLADLDPAGSDLIWRFREASGQPLDPDRGLVSLGVAVRPGGTASDGVADVAAHVQQIEGGLWALAGVRSPEQVTGLGPVWPQIASALAAAPSDVVADVGRVVPGSPTMPVLERSQLILAVVRADPASYAHLRERIAALAEPLALRGRAGRRVGVLVVADDREAAAVKDLQRLLDIEGLGRDTHGAKGLGVEVLGRIAHDPKGAAALNGLRTGGAGRSLLVRSVRGLLPELSARVLDESAA